MGGAPKTTRSVFGFDGPTLEVTQLYTDDRGVTRTYRGTLTDEQWHLERAAPDFHQPFVGEFRRRRAPDRRPVRILAGRQGFWELDFPITYRRSEAPS